MKKINSIQFIDTLAEMTRYQDREVIEKSLLKTISEYEPTHQFSLYQVIASEPEITLGLLSYTSKHNIVTTEKVKRYRLPSEIHNGIVETINSGTLKVFERMNSELNKLVIYPAYNRDNNIFAVLIQKTDAVDTDSQRLIYGFLRIYSNYLELIEQTKRDKLTGLLNRETLDDEISRIIIHNNMVHDPLSNAEEENDDYMESESRRKIEKEGYWLGVLDIDFFKRINDEYGHLYGDEVLILVARLMERSVRTIDLVFRFGGEEFVILLKAENSADAEAGFERISHAIKTHKYANIEQLTISIGVTQIQFQEGSSHVISEADEALYYAKSHGRDQVVMRQKLIDSGILEDNVEEYKAGEISFF